MVPLVIAVFLASLVPIAASLATVARADIRVQVASLASLVLLDVRDTRVSVASREQWVLASLGRVELLVGLGIAGLLGSLEPIVVIAARAARLDTLVFRAIRAFLGARAILALGCLVTRENLASVVWDTLEPLECRASRVRTAAGLVRAARLVRLGSQEPTADSVD